MIDVRFDHSHLEYQRRLAFALAMQANVPPTLAIAVRPLKKIARVIRAMLVGPKNMS